MVRALKGRVPVALRGCLHIAVFDVLLHMGSPRMRWREKDLERKNFASSFQTASYLCWYEGGAWWVVQAAQLALRMEVCGCCRLRFDNGCEFVGCVVHSGSMGKVNESVGRDAVTTRRRTPVDTGQGLRVHIWWEITLVGRGMSVQLVFSHANLVWLPDVETSSKFFIKKHFIEDLCITIRWRHKYTKLMRSYLKCFFLFYIMCLHIQLKNAQVGNRDVNVRLHLLWCQWWFLWVPLGRWSSP